MDIPSIEELENTTLPELNMLLKQWGDLYSKRFDLDHKDYMNITQFYVSCSMMRENLLNGWRRWWRITIPVTESRYEPVEEEAHG